MYKKKKIQNKQKIVQTLLKWLFWTSINLDIIYKNIILAEVFVQYRVHCAPCLAPLPPQNIYKIFKQTNCWIILNAWIIYFQTKSVAPLVFNRNVYIFSAILGAVNGTFFLKVFL